MRTNDKSRFFRRAATGTSALALATALAAGPVHAQSASLSYNAPNPTVASGTVNVNRGQIAGVEVYDVQSPTAVLDFTPSDTTGTGVINFQNAGTTAVYQGTSDFTVLNRIVPTDPSRAIQFNGTVRSLVNSSPGGSVWFYSPGGIIAGSGAVFDVGSLLLSTGDPTGGSGTIGSITSFSLSSSNSNAAVTIQPGAQITATPDGSYVALVAPIVNQNGSVRVNGSAAYVAAEQATLSINQGLFDISVAVGSDGGGTPLTHNGTTTGPASTGGGDTQGIFMVAVPKNTAITMLIAPNGQLGFDVAGSASVENGAVYLQAGGNLSVDPTETIVNRIIELPQSTLGASIQIDSGNFTSPVAAQASKDMLITAGTSPGITLAGDSYFYGGNQVHLVANTNGVFTADKNLVLNSFGAVPGTVLIDALSGSSMTFANLDLRADALSGRFFTSAFDTSKGGSASLRTTGGTIAVNGVLNLSAVGSSPDPVSTTGGSVDISANGGAITAAANTFMDVSASASGATLTATAGQANVFADAGGSVKFSNPLSLNATGTGTNGASATGGAARVVTGVSGGAIEAPTMNLNADGIGGSGVTGSAGSGTGGSVLIQTQDTTATASIKTGSVFLSAVASGGDASSSATVTGGAANGGTAQVLIGKNGSFTATSLTSLEASAEGGTGAGGGAGGDAKAGNVQFSATGGTIVAQDVSLTTSADGGDGGSGPGTTTPGGAGGNVLAGGGASMFVNGGGSITATSATLDSSAFGGSGGSGFNGTGLAGAGGSATASPSGVSISGSGQITLDTLTIFVNASGGSTGSGLAQPGASGGIAKGGDAFVFAGGGTITLGSVNARSDATGGFGAADGSNGGDAFAANATLGGDTGGTVKILGGSLSLSADGFGGSPSSASTTGGAGGQGVGGSAVIFANAGSTVDSAATFVSLDASGSGGTGAGTGNGGRGQGGTAALNAGGGIITLASGVDLDGSGNGGSASGTGNGGVGQGGAARLGTFSGSSASKVVVNGDVNLDASGSGGFASAGNGGDGLGGTPADLDNGPFDKGAYLVATGGTVSVTGDVDMDASGNGGSGSTGGGAGTGGYTDLIVFGAAITAPGVVFIDSSGSGGDGFDGGSAGGTGTGGTSIVSATSGGDSLGGGAVPTGVPGSITLGSFFQDVSGNGGDGGTGAVGGAGGVGGNGLGGVTNLIAQAGSGTLVVGDVTMDISGFGGQGGAGGAAPSSGGNGGNGGRGGDGTGGFTNFGTASGPATTNNDGSAKMGTVQVTVFGGGGNGGDGTAGGNGGAGGTGTGGSATLLSRGSPVVTQAVNLLGFAIGGNGGAGTAAGAGGDAVGGSVGLLATNRFQRTERGSYQGTSFSASAFTQGGTGSSTGATTAGQVFAEVTQADVTLDSLGLFAFGTNPTPAGSESHLLVDAGTLNVATSTSASAVGDFRFGAVNGGVLKTSSLELSASGSLLPPASGTPGTIDVASGFFATFGGDFVTTSNFNTDSFFQVDAGGQLQVGDVTTNGNVGLTSGGALTTGNISAVEGLTLDAQGTITAGNLSTETGYGSISLTSGGDVTGGNIRSADGVFVSAAGNIAMGEVTAGLGDQELVFGDVEIRARSAINVGDVQAATVDIFTDEAPIAPFGGIHTGAITAETISVDGVGDVTTGNLKTGDFYAGIDTSFANYLIGVAATGNASVGTIETPTSAGLASREGSVTAGGISVGDSLLVLAKTDITTGGIAGGTGPGNNVFLSNISVLDTDPVFEGFQTLDDFAFFDPATLGDATPTRLDGRITLGGPVATGGFAAAAAGGFLTGSITAANRLLLDSGASLSLGDLTTGQALSLTSGGTLSVGNVQATTVDLTAADSVSAGAIAATGEVTVNAGSFASFSGQVDGTGISVTSSDLRLGPSGRLGTAATTQLRLVAQGSQVTLGGGGTSGYSIDATEAQGLRAQRIDFITGAPVTIATLSLNGSNAGGSANLIGDSGQLTVDSEAGIRVTGAFTLANAATGNRVTLRTSDRITVATDSGGMIALTGSGSGSLGGTLELAGKTIAVATSSLLDQLAANPNFSGRNQALATPANSSPNAAGNIQANRLELTATNLIAIQNSGSTTQFAGFSAGAGGMQVTSHAPTTAPLDLVIFGRVADSGGNFKMNSDTLGAITFSTGEGNAGVSSASAVNNCVVGGSGCTAAPPPPPETPPPPVIAQISTSVVDTIQGSLDAAADPEKIAALPTVTLITTIDTGQLRTDPVISDPVSGGGNPSLWDSPDQQNDRRERERRPTPGQGEDK